MTQAHPTNQDRRTNRIVGGLAILGALLVATGNNTISGIGGIAAALALVLSR